MVDLAIVIVNYNTKTLTLKCLESIYKNKPKTDFEIWLVDNNSTDDSLLAIKRNFPQVNLIKSDKNLGFAGGNNLALRRISSNSNYCLLLNSDTEVLKDALNNLLSFAKDCNYWISSCKLINKNGDLQPNSGELPKFLVSLVWLSGLDDIFRKFIHIPSYQERNKLYYQKDRRVGWVGGTAMLIKSEIFKKIGYLDDKLFMYGEDVEFCLRANKAGYKTGWTNLGEIMHLGGGSLLRPQLSQWKGEFHALIYIFNKYYGSLSSFILRLFIYFFIFLRIVSFTLLGKLDYARTYAKILINF